MLLSSAGTTVVAPSSTYIPLTVKGASGQSASLQQWTNSFNNILAQIGPTGYIGYGTTPSYPLHLSDTARQMYWRYNSTGGYSELTLGGGGGAIGKMILFTDGNLTSNSVANIAFTTNSSSSDTWTIGRVGVGATYSSNRMRYVYGANEMFAIYIDGGIQIGGTYGTSPGNGALNITSNSSSVVPLTVKGANGQTANLQEWQNTSGTVKASVSPSGDFTTNSTGWMYFGDASTDGTWRMGRSGDDFIHQRRESGVWVTKMQVLAL
jgi:hypothetical protein